MTVPITRDQVTAQREAESKQLVVDYLSVLGSQFFLDNPNDYFKAKNFLIRGITTPARWAVKKGVYLDDKHYRKILNIVINGIKRFGATANIGYFPGYFLACLQRHLSKNEERYIALGKMIRDRQTARLAKDLVGDLQIQEQPEQFTNTLADLSRLVTGKGTKKPRKKPPIADTDQQLGLL